MDWMYLVYFLLGVLLFYGARTAGRGEWNAEYTSLEQTKALQGITALGIALHHMAQKTCAPWHPARYTVHGLDVFLYTSYILVGIFLFCSGLGLYRSLHSKPDYLKGFLRRRVLPIVIAFYLSEIIYTLVRLAMGEKMDALTVVWYLSGLHMANFNSWYVIVIPFFYLVFWAAFRFCRREGTALFWVFLFTLGYTVLGAFIDHQSDWWMRGEWWYNSILLFPLGLLFARYEKQVTAFWKKGWLLWLVLSLAAFVLLLLQSEWLNANVWGFYGEHGMRLKVPHRLLSAGFQWLVAIAYASFWFLLMMKVRIGNRVLAWMGGLTLEIYLMHGIFVELFGYSFLDLARSLVYIRSVPLYVAVVLACTVPASMLFSLLWKRIAGPLRGDSGRRGNSGAAERRAEKRRMRRLKRLERPGGNGRRRLLISAGAAVLALAAGVTASSLLRGDPNVRVMNGLEFHMPGDYTRTYSDSRYAVWEYTGSGKNPGKLVLDGEIRDGKARSLNTAEEVLAECRWMTEAELYVNPQGVRMVRGFAEYGGSPERRYYIESDASVLLLCMLEDGRYYSRSDCEEVLLTVADSVRPAR